MIWQRLILCKIDWNATSVGALFNQNRNVYENNPKKLIIDSNQGIEYEGSRYVDFVPTHDHRFITFFKPHKGGSCAI